VTVELHTEGTHVVMVRVIACVCVTPRQSYDVTIELCVEGTGTRSANTLDLKNPYFRYTGQAAQPPPGVNHTSPSETYWGQLDAQGARQGECDDFTISYSRYY